MMIIMGVFDSLTGKDEKDRNENRNSTKELQNIRNKIIESKLGKNTQTAPEKSNKTDFPEDSKNLGNFENLELKLIKILNELEEIKHQNASAAAALADEIKAAHTSIDALNDFLSHLPRDVLNELKNMKQYQPAAYMDIKKAVGESVKAQVLSMVDTNILKVIKESGKISSLHLLEKVEARKVCSKNTLYMHLGRLEQRGLVTKRREGHEVFYLLPDQTDTQTNANINDATKEREINPQPDASKTLENLSTTSQGTHN